MTLLKTKLLQNKQTLSTQEDPSLSGMLLPTPVGLLQLTFKNTKLTRLAFLPTAEVAQQHSPINHTVQTALTKYFEKPCDFLDIELDLIGTPFQCRVWQALREIPLGYTMSYLALANKLKTSPRAIGNACRANPIPIIVPCHRVVAKNHIGGFAGHTAGAWLDIKKWLLKHEGLQF
jgi:methylated-DNA-[protein]-cysteine S-methyltransferase